LGKYLVMLVVTDYWQFCQVTLLVHPCPSCDNPLRCTSKGLELSFKITKCFYLDAQSKLKDVERPSWWPEAMGWQPVDGFYYTPSSAFKAINAFKLFYEIY